MSFLITRPIYDVGTHYLYHWSQSLIDEAKRLHQDVYDLANKKANKATLASYVKKQSPRVVVFNGHGSKTEMFGQDNEPIIRKGDNENILAGRRIYMRACDAGSELGPSIINAGAEGFIGYRQPFVFFRRHECETHPLTDDLARPFLECSNQVARSLIKGHSVSGAHERSMKEYDRKIAALLTSENPNGYLVPWLLSNRDSQVCLKKDSATTK